MAVREIAATFEAVCDCCKATEAMPHKGRPKYWSDFHILRDAYDWSGQACADGSIKLLLCLKCGEAATKALNAAFDEIRAASADTRPKDEDAVQQAASLASGAVPSESEGDAHA